MKKLSIKRKLLLILAITGMIAGCKKDDDSYIAELKSISEKQWTLKYIQNPESGYVSYYPGSQDKISIEFAENKQLKFKGVCNVGGARYTIENEKITITDLITTEVYCTGIDWEYTAGENLLGAYRYAIDNGKLTIYSNASFNLVFE